MQLLILRKCSGSSPTHKISRALCDRSIGSSCSEDWSRRKNSAIHGDTFWSNAGPLAIAALIAVLAVVGAVMFSGNESRISAPSGSSLSRHLAMERAQPNQFTPVEAEDAARLSQNEKFEADAGPYAFTGERPFVSVMSRPRSSVPLVVNSASYLDVRRSIDAGLLPPRESVRIEGMINHFPYEYPQPTTGEPFSLNLDVVTCPWEPTHRLVRIGLKGHQDVACSCGQQDRGRI